MQGDHPPGIGRPGARYRIDVREQICEPLPGKQRQDDLDPEIGLPGRNLPGIQEALQVGRGRVRRIELREGRSDQKDGR